MWLLMKKWLHMVKKKDKIEVPPIVLLDPIVFSSIESQEEEKIPVMTDEIMNEIDQLIKRQQNENENDNEDSDDDWSMNMNKLLEIDHYGQMDDLRELDPWNKKLPHVDYSQYLNFKHYQKEMFNLKKNKLVGKNGLYTNEEDAYVSAPPNKKQRVSVS